uniref:Uncharacterized protein n=1 Tax=Siphoviridae sp. ctkyH28 TaxID=2827585 RepID=A0A8S5LMV3_9CAUD|nr:MAG TPA: hypothetical protein [Siphoviridae sp. ctkyH28]
MCASFPGLDPIRLLDYPLVDVLDLISDQIEHNKRTRTADYHPQDNTDGERIIYRKADDSWF